MKNKGDILSIARRVRALADNGLVYSQSEYDTERYTELRDLSELLMSHISDIPVEEIRECFTPAKDYVTPKVDVRAVVFDGGGRLLMVRERADGLWSLPGGWADIGYSPSEVAVKEVFEETGLEVLPGRLLALLDKKCHTHPPALHYCYKVFISCMLRGGTLRTAFDTLDAGFFGRDRIPPLSLERVTKEQVEMIFGYLDDPTRPAVTD